MMDVFDKAKRSEVMSHIRAKENKDTELALLKLFVKHRIIGWRRHHPVFGKPDFVFLEGRLAVFVDGCFWHCCPKHYKLPSHNRPFWRKKAEANKKRDSEALQTLKSNGWNVIRIWECQLAKNPSGCVARIRRQLRLRSQRV